MSTSLSFEAPSDLSVGRVTIQGRGGVLYEWIATPGDRLFQTSEARPGYYVAEISPAGVRPQSIVFEVRAGVANTVSAPVFSAMALEGNGFTFVGVEDERAAAEALGEPLEDQVADSGAAPGPPPVELKPSRSADGRRRLALALSEEAVAGAENWRAFSGATSTEISGGGLTLRVSDAGATRGNAPPRVRLSIALEQVMVERLLLPMYLGGTAIALKPSPLATSDLEVAITPSDPEMRALVRALGAGTSEEAIAVRERILGVEGVGRFLEPEADRWGALLTGLLSLRFPDVFSDWGVEHGDMLVALCPWAYDAHVVRARTILSGASREPGDRTAALASALFALAKAQTLGSPYYGYANQLAGEMLNAVASMADLEPHLLGRAKRLLRRWQRDLPLQRGVGVSFTWLRRDPARLAERIMEPDRKVTGRLSQLNGNVVFRGRVELGSIGLSTPGRRPPKSAEGSAPRSATSGPEPQTDPRLDGVPALERPAGPADDPNKGRFGGRSAAGGYSLGARFGAVGSGRWATVTLIVEADESTANAPGPVLFCLHPTFAPQWVTAAFRGRRAAFTLTAWGGFTVGAWLPGPGVELECDLALLPDAPELIRTR